MPGLLENQVVIITGAGSGVGRAASTLFARHGAKVVAADIDLAAAESTVAEIAADKRTGMALQCDVANEAEVAAMVRGAVEEFGQLDVMYNNAGLTVEAKPGSPRRAGLVDIATEDMDLLQKVNVGGVVNGCRAAIREFQSRERGGVIVNTASVAGLIGWGGAYYGATKGAITSLTRTLALEVARSGIRVNSVCPAGMPTRFAGLGKHGPVSAEIRERMAAQHPLGRVIDPLDCANAALFLASDLASNITGVNLPVDGGLSAGVPPAK